MSHRQRLRSQGRAEKTKKEERGGRCAAKKGSAVTSKLLECDVEKAQQSVALLVGTTKLQVMGWLQIADACQGPPPRISFNKMSGVTEWKSACVLWINLNDHFPYYNEFSLHHNRLFVSWYGAASHTRESPVIQRLLDPDTPTVLFCRRLGEGYLNCGLIRVVEVSDSDGPSRICIKWELVQAAPVLEVIAQALINC